MPSMKAGYSRSVSRGSGSSRKYSFNVPAMALMSMSLSITRMSLVSAGQTDTRGVNKRTAAVCDPSRGVRADGRKLELLNENSRALSCWCVVRWLTEGDVMGESLTGVKCSFESLDISGHP